MAKPVSIPSRRRPAPPGEILLREFLEPLGITQAAFARRIGITAARLSEIIHGKRPGTMDSALRIERALGFAAESWLRMQLAVDMYDALRGPAAKSVAKSSPSAGLKGALVVAVPRRVRDCRAEAAAGLVAVTT